MARVSVGKKVGNFRLPATGDQEISLSDLKGKNLVLYFYPKDSTPGCTTEGQDFRDNFAAFEQANTVILGVSRDSIESHENFKAKHSFPFELLSDQDESLCKQFDVIKLKKLYGKEHMGIERSTFLIDAEGRLAQEWRKVKVKDHVAEVLAAVKRGAPATQVIVITAHATTETAVEAMKGGAYDYVLKPFKVDEMRLVIDRALEKRRLLAENLDLRQRVRGRFEVESMGPSGAAATPAASRAASRVSAAWAISPKPSSAASAAWAANSCAPSDSVFTVFFFSVMFVPPISFRCCTVGGHASHSTIHGIEVYSSAPKAALTHPMWMR